MAEPGSWSDETYFGIGAVWGLSFAFSFEGFERVVAVFALAVGTALVGGFLGVALREDIVYLIFGGWFWAT